MAIQKSELVKIGFYLALGICASLITNNLRNIIGSDKDATILGVIGILSLAYIFKIN
jgi:hypothetical protein